MSCWESVRVGKPTEHECPYGGGYYPSPPDYKDEYVECGKDRGWLCHRCREDRADARFAALELRLLEIAGAPLRRATSTHNEMLSYLSELDEYQERCQQEILDKHRGPLRGKVGNDA